MVDSLAPSSILAPCRMEGCLSLAAVHISQAGKHQPSASFGQYLQSVTQIARPIPVQVLCGVAHAIDAMVSGEVVLDGILQGCVVLASHSRATSHRAADHPNPSLTIHLHSCEACRHQYARSHIPSGSRYFASHPPGILAILRSFPVMIKVRLHLDGAVNAKLVEA